MDDLGQWGVAGAIAVASIFTVREVVGAYAKRGERNGQMTLSEQMGALRAEMAQQRDVMRDNTNAIRDLGKRFGHMERDMPKEVADRVKQQ